MDAVASVRQSVALAMTEAVVQYNHRHYLLAVSGGLDSMVLLDAMAAVAREQPSIELTCVYVNHGLHPEAAEWGEQVEASAERIGVNYLGLSCGPIKPGEQGLEAAARDARYACLAGSLQSGDVLVTAHHRNDQAETVLLQMLRGAGVAGMSAMPVVAPFGPGLRFRPLLGVAQATLAAYAKQRSLHWVEDPSNDLLRHDRNFLRNKALPVLQSRWPAAVSTLSRLAATCADAQQILDAAAQTDLADADSDGVHLSCELVRTLAPARARNLLRFWIRSQGFAPPSRVRLEALLNEVAHAREDAAPRVRWEGCEVRRYRDVMYAMAPLAKAPAAPVPLTTGSSVALQDGSTLRLERCTGAGIASERLQGAILEVGWRRGGERLVLDGRSHSTSLKKLFQQLGVLPWMRKRLPLILVNGEVAAVANLLVAAPFAASAQSDGYTVIWNAMPEICAPAAIA